MAVRYRDMTDRLMANSVVIDTGCWQWIGAITPKGYGKLNVYCKVKRKTVSRWAHRVAYETLVGPIPDDMQVDHTCEHEGCINPNHFELVTNNENLKRRDAARKTRR